MSDAWEAVRAARVPAAGLAALAPVRCQAGVTVHRLGEAAWVVWPPEAEEVVRCLRPVRGVEFFAEHGGRWHRFGHRLPCADGPPHGAGEPLDRVLIPAPLTPLPPEEAGPPVRLGIVRGGAPRPATALRCAVRDLAHWADTATTAELAAVRAARCGGRALLLGERLPTVHGGERFWGERVLVPLGFRPEPELPDAVLREACGVTEDELLILDAAGAEAVPERALQPLTRAGVRLAIDRSPLSPEAGERGE
jgi:MoxR-vWA-beta-propeller ternary system domain bpX2